jgi:type II secretory pathway pseudopilin PulG
MPFSHVNAPSHNQGNWLVELVVVVTVLGIIGSFAIPRFTHLENDVRASEVAALSVNLRSAAAAAHSQYVESGAKLSFATLKGRVIHLKDGYPDPSGIRVAIADLSDFTVSSTPTSVTYSKTDAPAPAQCAVTYHAFPAASNEAAITDLKISGC